MRNILAILVIGILIFSGIGAIATPVEKVQKNITEKIKISSPTFNQEKDYVKINLLESNLNLMASGKPLLPKITKTYTFPFGTKITDVKVTFSEEIMETISNLVIPSPEILPISTMYKDKIETEKIITYSEIDTYPEKRYSYRKGAGLEDGEHVIFLTVNIYPIQYTPKINTITYSTTADISIDYNVPTNPIVFGDDYDLLIITPAQFVNELQPLVDYKNSDETSTLLVTLDEIPDEGADKQESIKYYIKDAIETMGVTYLLLVGAGVEGSELFPVRNAWVPSGSYEKYFPSDLYYADIYNGESEFSDWDKDDDGKHAEYSGINNDMAEVDMYPDIYLGKLPCNNKNELEVFVQKIIDYEEHNMMTNKIVQVGGDTFPGDPENVNEGEYANEHVLSKLSGYTSIKLWGSNEKLTKADITNAVNSNVDFLDFSGHGSPTSWATHPPGDEEHWIPEKVLPYPFDYDGYLYVDIGKLTNSLKLPVIVFNACSCNKYSATENSISWYALKKSGGGGIASFGASGIGYGSYGTHEVERVWGWMEVHIFEAIYNDKVLGQAWANCLNLYIDSFIEDGWDESDYKTILEMSMFGDPTLVIEDGKDPKSHNILEKTVNYLILEKLVDKLPKLELLLQLLQKI
jgi:hypothetical protein